MKSGRDFSVGILRGGTALNSASSPLAASLLDWIQALTGERCLCSVADGPLEELSCEDHKIWTVLAFKPSGRILENVPLFCRFVKGSKRVCVFLQMWFNPVGCWLFFSVFTMKVEDLADCSLRIWITKIGFEPFYTGLRIRLFFFCFFTL